MEIPMLVTMAVVRDRLSVTLYFSKIFKIFRTPEIQAIDINKGGSLRGIDAEKHPV